MPARTFPRLIAGAALLLCVGAFSGCADLRVDTASLLAPRFQRSEVIGIIAGFGTTFAAVPDMVAMLRRRSAAGMNPMMAALTGAFQIVWVYYGLLIASRPVIAWNAIGVLVNCFTVAAYVRFARKEAARVPSRRPRTESTDQGDTP